jgi:t-SNARE complex subunit (syntaxin)
MRVSVFKGDVAVTRSVNKRYLCYGILIVAIVVIGSVVLYPASG